jgi:hypothetical protein
MVPFLLIWTVPTLILGSVSIVRWNLAQERGQQPRFQYHLSDLVTGTFWLGIALIVAEQGYTKLLHEELSPMVVVGTAAFGLLTGKIWELTMARPTFSLSAVYLSVSAIISIASVEAASLGMCLYEMRNFRVGP